tara:strand:+ start:2410 stop:3942 length:1533 start_codon:yes stop_codon:yes gene_type:complete
MATGRRTYDLISCNTLNSTLTSQFNVGFHSPSDLNDKVIEFNGYAKTTYTLKKNVQGQFKHPSDATSTLSKRYTVTSVLFNGVEQIVTPAILDLAVADYVGKFTTFPLYTAGFEHEYFVEKSRAISTVGSSGSFGYENFTEFLRELLVTTLKLPVRVNRNHPDLYTVDSAVTYHSLTNFVIEKFASDNIIISITETDNNLTTTTSSDTKWRYEFYDANVASGDRIKQYKNNTLLTGSDAAQHHEEFSFFQYAFAIVTKVEKTVCPIVEPFDSSLSSCGCPTLNVSCDCNTLEFSDTSNYVTNGLIGHDSSDFTSRTITITKPGGGTYVLATSDVTTKDQTIQPHNNSNNSFAYSFANDDEDGIYSVQVCSYPNWRSDVSYQDFLEPIVLKNGKYYKCVTSNINSDPELDTTGVNWVEHACTTGCDDTRYCATEKIVVICISLLKEYKAMVSKALCEIEANTCKNICENDTFMNAMKFRITLDALENSVCASDWVSAQKHMDVLKNITCCG